MLLLYPYFEYNECAVRFRFEIHGNCENKIYVHGKKFFIYKYIQILGVGINS